MPAPKKFAVHKLTCKDCPIAPNFLPSSPHPLPPPSYPRLYGETDLISCPLSHIQSSRLFVQQLCFLSVTLHLSEWQLEISCTAVKVCTAAVAATQLSTAGGGKTMFWKLEKHFFGILVAPGQYYAGKYFSFRLHFFNPHKFVENLSRPLKVNFLI